MVTLSAALSVLALKGVLLKKDGVSLAIREAAAAGDADAYGRAVDAATKLVGEADAKALAAEVGFGLVIGRKCLWPAASRPSDARACRPR